MLHKQHCIEASAKFQPRIHYKIYICIHQTVIMILEVTVINRSRGALVDIRISTPPEDGMLIYQLKPEGVVNNWLLVRLHMRFNVLLCQQYVYS